MDIEINKDFLREYKDDAWKGFSLKELLSLAGAAVVGISIDMALHFGSGMSLAGGVYIALPFALPLIFVGFYRYQGHLGAGKFLQEMSYFHRTREMSFESREGETEERSFRMELDPSVTGKSVKKPRRDKRVGRYKKGVMRHGSI